MDEKVSFALNEASKLDSVEMTIEDLDLMLKAFTEVIQSIYDFMPSLKDGEEFIETMSIKIMLSSRSILKLIEGEVVSTTKQKGGKLVDFASINILARSIIEAFLTLEYLFFNKLTDSEKNFRFDIWKISGYKSRQNFFENRNNLNNYINKKLDFELKEMNDLLFKIESSPHYKELNKQNLWKLDKYGLPRLSSWQDLLENSILKTSLFSTSYKLYSNHAHSEFISLIQMKDKTLNKYSEENNLNIRGALTIVKMLCCVSIVFLKNKFECTNKTYSNLDVELKQLIEFWCQFAIDKPNIDINDLYS